MNAASGTSSDRRLRKYWVLGQRRRAGTRFHKRLDDPLKRWKLSPMDLESLTRWEDYSRAKGREVPDHTAKFV
ncbi:hypothetical protein AB0E59_17945 [Lentzea sp. NPDC034063]|uniref:hypothetical protein n=1 Tax=unclassified Lentzea TaxID=2643253 RepID=UPI0033ECFB9E